MAKKTGLARLLPSVALSREVLHLALPVTLGSLTYTLLTVVDTAMLGRLGATPLAASGVAGGRPYCIFMGFPTAGLGSERAASNCTGKANPTVWHHSAIVHRF